MCELTGERMQQATRRQFWAVLDKFDDSAELFRTRAEAEDRAQYCDAHYARIGPHRVVRFVESHP